MSVAKVRGIVGTSSTTETLMTRQIIVTKRETNSTVSATTKGIEISTVPTMIILLDIVLRMEGTMKVELKLSAMT
jgi:hypothetical protein